MKFAVVGRSNKGKSSIVATLVENDEILIAPLPRTTQKSQEFELKVGHRSLLTVVDTPGFEEAPAVLDWLQIKTVAAHERPQRVREFYETFKDTDRFRFECELLKPILEGACILYVVDASHPFRSNFEAEFEILRWTGQPSLALVNQSGDGQWLAEWQRALEQYFRKTLHFNAHRADFSHRMRILEELRFLSDAARPLIDEAIAFLRAEHESRLQASALALAGFIGEAWTMSVRKPLPADDKILEEDFYQRLRSMERKSRETMAQIFNFKMLALETPETKRSDLFSRETWEMMGLPAKDLVALGVTVGGTAGGVIDASVGGASFLLGAALGAVTGGAAAGALIWSNPKLAGIKLSKKYLVIGPIKNPNFPWILLDRGLLFMEGLLLRTHAQRGPLLVEVQHQGPSSRFSKKDKARLAWNLFKIRKTGMSETSRQDLARIFRGIMGP